MRLLRFRNCPLENLADDPVDSQRELRADPNIGVRDSVIGVKRAFRTRGQKRAKLISYWLRRGFGNLLRRVSSRKQRTQGELRPHGKWISSLAAIVASL